jgi:hypothetical protein
LISGPVGENCQKSAFDLEIAKGEQVGFPEKVGRGGPAAPTCPPHGGANGESSSFAIPGIALAEAVSLGLLEDLLRQLVPPVFVTALEGRFNAAGDKLRGFHTIASPSGPTSSAMSSLSP